MDDLVDYTTGGIIHIVLNNQIGFTTHPKQSRSSYYCTEVAKVVDAPVFHVNGDDPDILDRCIKMAVAYRYKFKKDIFIDIVGYRRHGHNEQDQPNFTQPIMYDKIKNKLSVFETYSQKLVSKGVVTQEEIQALKDGFNAKFEEDYKKVMEDRHDRFTDEDLPIQQIRPPVLWGTKTGVPLEVLADIMNKVTTWPTDF